MKETEPILPDEAALGKMTAEERRGFFGRLLRLIGLAGDAEKPAAGTGDAANAAARDNTGEPAGNGNAADGDKPGSAGNAADADKMNTGNANTAAANGGSNGANAAADGVGAADGANAANGANGSNAANGAAADGDAAASDALGAASDAGLAMTDEEAIDTLTADPRFPDFGARLAEAKTILHAIPALAAVAPRGRYLLGYFAARGLADYREQKKGKSAAALVDALCAREDAVKLYETKRIAALDASAAAYPRHAGGFSTASVPATPKKTPRNLDEACAAALGLFGLAR